MPEGALANGRRRSFAADDLARRWLIGTGLAAAVAVAYFLAGRLGVGLILKPEGVAVFWPAAGISSGVFDRARPPGAMAGGGRRGRRHCRGASPHRPPPLGPHGAVAEQ